MRWQKGSPESGGELGTPVLDDFSEDTMVLYNVLQEDPAILLPLGRPVKKTRWTALEELVDEGSDGIHSASASVTCNQQRVDQSHCLTVTLSRDV